MNMIETILTTILFIPWLLVTIWWIISFVYYFFIHQESKKTTKDFGVKILTIGWENEMVMAKTIKNSPKEPYIISRIRTIFKNNFVLPGDFKCRAIAKGEQLEYGRKALPFENTLYLDEDSVCSKELEYIPDNDIVQFQEIPHSKSWFITAIEAQRIGFQIEQAMFEKVKPLYLWGGGWAVKRNIEDKITWDFKTITEDSVFVYQAENAEYKFSKKEIHCQAPLTVLDLIKQRWRWASGGFDSLQYIKSPVMRLIVAVRLITWGWWIPISIVLFFLNENTHWFLTIPLAFIMVWSAVGAYIMKLNWKRFILSVFTAPITSYIHSFGATIALFKRQKTFNVTKK